MSLTYSLTHSHSLTHSLTQYRYTYDRRITDDDPNVESGWNIWNISASLSWLDRFDSPRDALSACLDRSLIFPYVFERSYSLALTRISIINRYARLWKLSVCCVRDVQTILRHGRRTILDTLLRIRRIFKSDYQRYLMNRMFLDDYVVWIQYVALLTYSFSNISPVRIEQQIRGRGLTFESR